MPECDFLIRWWCGLHHRDRSFPGIGPVTDSRLCIGEETDRAPGNSTHGGWHDQADQLGKSAEAEAAGTAPFPPIAMPVAAPSTAPTIMPERVPPETQVTSMSLSSFISYISFRLSVSLESHSMVLIRKSGMNCQD